MSLRARTSLIITFILGFLVLLMYLSSRYFLLDSFAGLEQQYGSSQVNQALNAFNDALSSSDKVARDWATWDESYAFVLNGNREYIASNLLDVTFENLNANLLLFYNNSGQLVYGKAYNLTSHCETVLPPTLQARIAQSNLLLAKRGLILLPEGPLMLASRPMRNSEGQGPIHGALIVGRFLDSSMVKSLASTTRLNINFIPYQTWLSSSASSATAEVNSASPGQVFIRIINQQRLQGYSVLYDLAGQPALVLTVDLPRDIYHQGQSSLQYFFFSLLATGLIFGLGIMFFLEKFILARLFRLNRDLKQIRDFNQADIRVDIMGNDEISKVAASINTMLAALEQAHQQLIDSDIHLHRITDNMLDALCQLDRNGIYQYCTPSFVANLGYIPEELLGKSIFDLIHPDEVAAMQDAYHEMMIHAYTGQAVCRLRHALGHYLWTESSASLLREDGSDEVTGAVVVSRDITQRKLAEEALLFLSEHDSLTNLYNRMFFRQQILNLDRDAMTKVGLICGDLNGLRLINDTMGYQTGDSLLVITAEIIDGLYPP